MDITFTEEDEKFRLQVRKWFQVKYPQHILEKQARGESLTKEDLQISERALAKQGWLTVNWPKEYGGPGWSATQKYIFDEELERAGAPGVVPMGVIYVGPVIYTFGTPEQKKRWLPGIQKSTTFWAQGYSEPGSGSDLASLSCKAEQEGDAYLVNGTKIWTSLAQHADWIFCLVRTSQEEKKQNGISFLCIDMTTPGVTVHPIITIDGKHSLNRVEFENVRVPLKNRIGEDGKGWTYANYLLGHERTSYAHVAAKRTALAQLKIFADSVISGNRTLADDRLFRKKYAGTQARLDSLEFTVLRLLASVEEGGAPGQEASIVKILATEVAQEITELFLDLAGPDSHRLFEDSVTPDWALDSGLPGYVAPEVSSYFGTRAQTIYGGTNEIQRNIIAKRILGL